MNVTVELGYVYFVMLHGYCEKFAWYSYWQPWHIKCQDTLLHIWKTHTKLIFILTWPL